MEYYLVIKKNEKLHCVITYMDLEGVTLSEMSGRETSTMLFHLYVEFKKQKKGTKKTN